MNNIRLDTRMLTGLELLLSERNISKAAKRVGLSQPAMSNTLARLRRYFSDPLLVYGPGGLILTPRAEKILEQVRRLNADLDALLVPDSFDPQLSREIFRVATSDYASFVLMPAIVKRVRESAPRVTIMTAVVPTDLNELEAQRYDLRIGWLRSLPAHWYRRTLINEGFVVMGAASNARFRAGLTAESFCELRHVVMNTVRPLTLSHLDSLLNAHGLTRDIALSVDHFSTIPAVVAETDLIAVIPTRLAKIFQRSVDVLVQPLPVTIGDYDTSMGWHPRSHEDPSQKWLREVIGDVASKLN